MSELRKSDYMKARSTVATKYPERHLQIGWDMRDKSWRKEKRLYLHECKKHGGYQANEQETKISFCKDAIDHLQDAPRSKWLIAQMQSTNRLRDISRSLYIIETSKISSIWQINLFPLSLPSWWIANADTLGVGAAMARRSVRDRDRHRLCHGGCMDAPTPSGILPCGCSGERMQEAM